jgi:hypothetical protein
MSALHKIHSIPIPLDNDNGDVSLTSYKGNFKGTISFISVDPSSVPQNNSVSLVFRFSEALHLQGLPIVK